MSHDDLSKRIVNVIIYSEIIYLGLFSISISAHMKIDVEFNCYKEINISLVFALVYYIVVSQVAKQVAIYY